MLSTIASTPACAVCTSPTTALFERVDGYDYFQCSACSVIFIDPVCIKQIDGGADLVTYSDKYWQQELAAARERSFGSSLARLAEAILYCQIPVTNVVDVGSGPGFLLDAVALHLPENAHRFYGIEKFPPPPEWRTRLANYIVGDVSDLNFKIDLGLCIEVIEHLTPSAFKGLLSGLSKKSTSGALFLFNTGLAPFVATNRAYLDPLRRGHIMSYSIESVRLIAEPFGFHVHALRGRAWAFVLEYDRRGIPNEDLLNRVWTALPENKALLESDRMGTLLKIVGYETARAYHYGSAVVAD